MTFVQGHRPGLVFFMCVGALGPIWFLAVSLYNRVEVSTTQIRVFALTHAPVTVAFADVVDAKVSGQTTRFRLTDGTIRSIPVVLPDLAHEWEKPPTASWIRRLVIADANRSTTLELYQRLDPSYGQVDQPEPAAEEK